MKVKVKKLVEGAKLPFYATEGAAGMDLTATSKEYDNYGCVVYGTGLAFEIPQGYVGLLFPRSSNAKKNLLLTNSVGVLDSDYRGEVFFKFKRVDNGYEGEQFAVGDAIGQIIIVPYPHIEFELSDELSTTLRGAGGYGSTGK